MENNKIFTPGNEITELEKLNEYIRNFQNLFIERQQGIADTYSDRVRNCNFIISFIMV